MVKVEGSQLGHFLRTDVKVLDDVLAKEVICPQDQNSLLLQVPHTDCSEAGVEGILTGTDRDEGSGKGGNIGGL